MRRAALQRARAGLTLLELLLVLGILAVVMGTGLGALAAIDPGPARSEGALRAVLRAAAGAARQDQAGARVRIDAARSRLWVESLRLVGTWHCEGDLRGAFGLEGATRGVRWVDGWLGRAIAFDGTRGSSAGVAVDDDPAFDPSEGFAIELALRPEGAGGGRALALGGAIALEVGPAGELAGEIALAPEERAGGRAAGSGGGLLALRSGAGAAPAGRWTRVRFAFDGRRATLAADGVVVAATSEEGRVAALEGPLVLSDPALPFRGALDALTVAVRAAGEPLTLARGVRFGPDTPAVLELDGQGRLDPAAHPRAVSIALVSERGAARTLVLESGAEVRG